MTWKLADAKNRLSELVNSALSEGPQRIQRRGDVVIVLSEHDFDRLRGARPNLRDYLLEAPDLSGLDLDRDRRPMREVEL